MKINSSVDVEKHLDATGTRIIKFYLHVSNEEQRKRLLERIDEPEKNWKCSATDIEERKFWKQYMKAYETCLDATSTNEAPWYVMPAGTAIHTQATGEVNTQDGRRWPPTPLTP